MSKGDMTTEQRDTLLTPEFVREKFEYREGALYWRDSGLRRSTDKPAGNLDSTGYVVIGGSANSLRWRMPAHRLVYLYHYGYLPPILDHIDGNRSNNSIDNLRPALARENQANRRRDTRSTSGHKNVSYSKAAKKWRAMVRYMDRRVVGYFADISDAAEFARKAREQLHGQFARHE